MSSSKTSSALKVSFVLLTLLLIAGGMVDNHYFMRRTSGVMSAEAAAKLGVIDVSGPWFKRIWFARRTDGSYEVRPAAPFIGVLPFTSIGTALDLQAACAKLGDACKPRD